MAKMTSEELAALTAGDLERWVKRRGGGKSGSGTSRNDRKKLKGWNAQRDRRDPRSRSVPWPTLGGTGGSVTRRRLLRDRV
jgi:hypothetical protein